MTSRKCYAFTLETCNKIHYCLIHSPINHYKVINTLIVLMVIVKEFLLFTHPFLSSLEGCFKISTKKQIRANKVALQKSVLPLSIAS